MLARLCLGGNSADFSSRRRSSRDPPLDGRICHTLLDELASEVVFGSKGVVGLAAQCEVVRARRAATCMREAMVGLEKPGLSTALTRVIDKGAARPVSIPYLAPHCG